METKAILSELVRLDELSRRRRKEEKRERRKEGEVCLARKSSTLISPD
jgi:hypothetical protein